jgi:hypothetical protein
VVGRLRTAAQARILKHCGLPWEEAVTAFNETERVVHTFSQQQVKQGIYASSVQAASRYEHLLRPALASSPAWPELQRAAAEAAAAGGLNWVTGDLLGPEPLSPPSAAAAAPPSAAAAPPPSAAAAAAPPSAAAAAPPSAAAAALAAAVAAAAATVAADSGAESASAAASAAASAFVGPLGDASAAATPTAALDGAPGGAAARAAFAARVGAELAALAGDEARAAAAGDGDSLRAARAEAAALRAALAALADETDGPEDGGGVGVSAAPAGLGLLAKGPLLLKRLVL